jgi:hypothetical protein
MPIVIPRNGPVVPAQAPALTAEQRKALWEHIVQSYCQQHPEKLQSLVQDTREVPA